MIASLRGLEAMKSACYLRLRDISNDLEIVDSPLFSAISARQVLELQFQTTTLRLTQYRYKRFSNGIPPYKDLLDWRRWDSMAMIGVGMAAGCGIYYVAQ